MWSGCSGDWLGFLGLKKGSSPSEKLWSNCKIIFVTMICAPPGHFPTPKVHGASDLRNGKYNQVLLNGCFQSDQLRSIYYAFKRTTCCPSKSALTLLPLHLPVKLSNMVCIYRMFCILLRSYKNVELLQESLPNLPNEIWSSIIEYLSADDRKSIASVDNKFQALEGKTGYRRFVNVKIASVSRFIMNFLA